MGVHINSFSCSKTFVKLIRLNFKPVYFYPDCTDGPSSPGRSWAAGPNAGAGGVSAAPGQSSLWGHTFLFTGVCR